MIISICILHQSTLFVGRDNLDLTSGTLSKLSGVDSTGGMSGTCGWSSKQLQLPRANFVQTSVRDTQFVAMLTPDIQWRMGGSIPKYRAWAKAYRILQACWSVALLRCTKMCTHKNPESRRDGHIWGWCHDRYYQHDISWHFKVSKWRRHGASVGKLCHICHNSEAVSSRARRSASGRQGSRCGVLGELHPHDAWENMMNMARWCEGISRYIQNISSLEPQIIPQTDARKPTIGGGRSGFQDIYSRFVLSVPMYLLGMPRKASVR